MPGESDDMTMRGRVVLVTGSARGIGREVARQLAELGAIVFVSARAVQQARDAAAALSASGDVRALEVPLDVSSDASVREMAKVFGREPGRLDVLINNAAGAVDWSETAAAADLDEARKLFDINLFGAWRTTQALLPLLRMSEHPRIVNVSSAAGSHAGDGEFGLAEAGGVAASYGISKAALNALTSALAAELADTPILVNAVCPGQTATWPGAEEMGARPLAEGAASVVWAATLPDGVVSGGFFRDGEKLDW